MKLQERLLRIAGYVPLGSVAADIGTDHALLPVHLVKQGICHRVIATDIHTGPLATARSTVALYSLRKQVELRQGDGLEVVQPGEIDVIIIAGMGGSKIVEILGRAQDVLLLTGRLILQPLGGVAQVRRWLLGNGWILADEDLVLDDDHYYEIIVSEHQAATDLDQPGHLPGHYDEDDADLLLEIGPGLVKKEHPLLVVYLDKQIQDMESVLLALRRAQTPAARERRQAWARRISYYKKIIKLVEHEHPEE